MTRSDPIRDLVPKSATNRRSVVCRKEATRTILLTYHRPVVAVWLGILALAAADTSAASFREPTPSDQSLLRRSDLAALAPRSFRARMRLSTPERPEPAEIEVWRSDESRTLVRFLDPKERGKYLLYRDRTLFFIAPGAKKPVKLPGSFRLRGSATLDDILGLQYSRDFSVAGVADAEDEQGTITTFSLTARERASPYATVRYAVRRATSRPVQAEYCLKSGKLASVVEFAEWEPGPVPRVRRLLLKDMLRAGVTTEVLLISFEEGPVPAGLFDLKDASARSRLEHMLLP